MNLCNSKHISLLIAFSLFTMSIFPNFIETYSLCAGLLMFLVCCIIQP
uniref:Uncharacterized protein n=1 Tax=Rhizophora mucronata TaxID=61149 RepID=A0A2P2P4J1_RHIMU